VVKSSCRLCRFNNGIISVVEGRMDSKVVDDDDVISCLRNFDANAMATHEHCIVNARKSMRKKKLR